MNQMIIKNSLELKNKIKTMKYKNINQKLKNWKLKYLYKNKN